MMMGDKTADEMTGASTGPRSIERGMLIADDNEAKAFLGFNGAALN